MSNYSRAERRAGHWYGDGRYRGATIKPNKVVVHTTEGTSLPSYEDGATAPHYTGIPDFRHKKIHWVAHFPDEQSSRALQNDPGGVETNTEDAIQIELVGTCDPTTSTRWGTTKHIYWGNAPYWALKEVALFALDMKKRHGIPIQGPPHKRWVEYPESYGNRASQRLSYAEWLKFTGWCGHQHVPENDHGDPGSFNFKKLVEFAKDEEAPDMGHLAEARHYIHLAITHLLAAEQRGEKPRLRIVAGRKALRAVLRALPTPKDSNR